MVSESARAFTIPFIPTWRVVDDYHSRMRPGAERAGVIGIDRIPLMTRHSDGFRQHAFVHIGLVHSSLLEFNDVMRLAEHLIQNSGEVQ